MLDTLLLVVLIICLITDIRKQKIYNKVVFPSLIVAMILNCFDNGFFGLKFSLVGFIVGFVILLIPYLMGGIGAGDVKLLAFIGTVKGAYFVLNTAVYMAVIGGFIALIIILCNKERLKIFKEILLWIKSLIMGIAYKMESSNSPLTQKYPYGIAIVFGALICLFIKGALII